VADLQDKQAGERPRCPSCGQVLEGQGKQDRTILTHGGRAVHLKRDYARCLKCSRQEVLFQDHNLNEEIAGQGAGPDHGVPYACEEFLTF
jgi:ribosomal protein L34E